MEILIYLLLLFILEAFAVFLAIGLDYFCKYKKLKIVKSRWFFIRSKFNKTKTIGLIALLFQIFNYIYIIAYITLSIIYIYVFRHVIIYKIIIYSLVIYGISTIISLYIVGFSLPLRNGKE